MRNKLLILTGGAGIIGKQTIFLAKKAGYKTLSLDLVYSKYADKSLVVDISKEDEVESAFKEIDCLDALVCLASTNIRNDIENLSWESWQHLMAVNVRGAMLSLKYASPRLNMGSSIVLKSSLSAYTGSNGNLAYQTSKGAVIGLMRATSGEFVERGIRVNAICSGSVNTPLNFDNPGKTYNSELSEMNVNETHYFARMAKPKEIAEGIMFLISSDSSFVTGTELIIDGGFLRNR
jgi:NAD(P)-dependent dehydrogenase (short-subunit alcohol dehydrogenase family)